MQGSEQSSRAFAGQRGLHKPTLRAQYGAPKRADLPIAEVRIAPGGAIVIIHGEPHSAAQSSKFTDWDEDLSSRSLVMSMSDGIATAATSIGISGAIVVYGNCRVSRALRNLRRSTNA